MINEDEAPEPMQPLVGVGTPVHFANHLTWTDERNPGDGHLEHIAVANNGNVWAIRRDTGQAYFLSGAGSSWQTPGSNWGPTPRFNSISVAGSQGEHVWATATDQSVYYRRGLGGRWERQEGGLDQVVVCGNHGQQVLGLMNGVIHARPGNPGQNGQWSSIPGPHGGLSQIACGGANGTHLWGVTSRRTVYYQEGIRVAPVSLWNYVPGQRLDYISVGGDEGQHVYGMDRANTYSDMYRNGYEADWTTFGGDMTEMVVGGDEGQHVWGINKTVQWNYIKAANHGNVNENTN